MNIIPINFSKRRELKYLLISIIVAILFIIIATPMLELPGIYYDEVGGVSRVILHRAGLYVTKPYIEIFNIPIYFMGSQYTGSWDINVYSVASRFYYDELLVRYIPILWGAIAVGLFSVSLRDKIKNKFIFFISNISILTFPTIIFYARTGMHTIFLRFLIATIFTLFVQEYTSKRNSNYLYIIAFISGMSLTVRLELIWLPISYFCYLLIFDRTTIINNIKVKKLFKLLLFFAIGAFPLIVYNLLTDWSTITRILNNSIETQYGHNNLNIIPNVILRIQNILSLFRSDVFFAETGSTVKNYVALTYFIFSFYMATLKLILKRNVGKYVPYLYITLIVGIPISTFSITRAGNPMHLLVLFPAALMLMLLMLSKIVKNLTLLGIIISILIFSNMYVTFNNYTSQRQYSGKGLYSEKIYELHDYLSDNLEELPKYPAYMDWGIRTNLIYLSNGNFLGEDYFGYQTDLLKPQSKWNYFLENPNDYYLVFHGNEQEVFKNRKSLLSEYLFENGLKLDLIHQIMEDDKPLYQIYIINSI